MSAPDKLTAVQENGSASRSYEIDEALELCQNRAFHWILLLISGLTFLAVACESTMQAYILPFVECDLKLTSAQVGYINAALLAGSLISSTFWGIYSDTAGRKRALVYGCFGQGILTIFSSFSINAEMFTIFRFGTGFMLGSASIIIIPFTGEFCSNRVRSTFICMLGFSWVISWFVIPGVSWLIIPLGINWQCGIIVYRSWRLFIALIGVPSIVSGFLLLCLPESPKFYLSNNQEAKALKVLQYMYWKNTGNTAEKYPVTKLVTSRETAENGKLSPDSSKVVTTFISLFWKMMGQMKVIFTPPLVKNVLLSGVVYSAGMFGYYSLGLWMPELLKRFDNYYDEYPNATLTLCELNRIKYDNPVRQMNETCENRSDINISLFTNSFILGGSCIISNLVAVLLSKKIPPTFVTGLFLLSAGIAAMAIYFVKSQMQILILASIFLSTGSAALSSHNVTGINVFPTAARGLGLCINFMFLRITAISGSIIIGSLIEVKCAVPFFLTGAFNLFGVICCLLISKSSQKAQE